MRAVLLAVLCFWLVAFPAQADNGFESKRAFSQWLAHYYVKPEPERIAEAIAYMSRSGILDDEHARSPMFGFLSGVFRDNPARIADWVTNARVSDERHLAVVVLGAWYAGLRESSDIAQTLLEAHPRLRRGLEFLDEDAPATVEEIPLERGAWVVDALWGKFMATGAAAPIERIAIALPWADLKEDTERMLIGGVARWSLTSNAVQHERVLAICERLERALEGPIAVKLREVIDDARRQLRGTRRRSLASIAAAS